MTHRVSGVPQIEVTLDANGIVTVSAKDKAPAKSRRFASRPRAVCPKRRIAVPAGAYGANRICSHCARWYSDL